MKTRRQVLVWMVALLSIVLPVSATSLSDIRVNARFLTDRMAYELNLTDYQYNDLYEVNYDFLRNVDPYLPGMACQDALALDYYYRYLDERNDDIRWILSSSEYSRFMALDYFFRPIYALNNLCYLRVYRRYPNRGVFFFRQPLHYMDYCGGHSREHMHGISFYQHNFAGRYNHPVFGGDFRNRPEHRRNDFGQPNRPMNQGQGFHFTPMQSGRPGMNAPRQEMNRQNQGMNGYRPNVNNNRPNMNNDRPNMNNNNRFNMNGSRPNMNNDRQSNQFNRQPQNENRFGSQNRQDNSQRQQNMRNESNRRQQTGNSDRSTFNRQSSSQRQNDASFNRERQGGQMQRQESRSSESRSSQSSRSGFSSRTR